MVTQKIGSVAYKLDLPQNSQIYPVFHVSCLKQKLGAHVVPQNQLPILTSEGTLTPEPEKLLLRRMKKKGNRATTEVLIQWKGMTAEEATWEDLAELLQKFPDLVGKVF